MNIERRNIERRRCAGHQFETTFSHARKLRLVITQARRQGIARRERRPSEAKVFSHHQALQVTAMPDFICVIMKSLLCFALLCFALQSNLFGQLHDNSWFLGYNNNIDTTDKFGVSVICFDSGGPTIYQNNILNINFSSSNASFSDSLGHLNSISNAIHIENNEFGIMDGGQNIIDGNPDGGGIWPQYIVAVPYPGHPNQHIYIYQNQVYAVGIGAFATKLLYAIVDMNKNNGRGAVIQKDILVLNDSINIGNLIPVRHANGRDWWLLANEILSNRYYRVLLSPTGINVIGNQEVGLPITFGVGQSVFSPDGRYFCSYNSISQTVGSYLDIYNFDRCTGLLSNHRQLHQNRGWGGIAISPKSRYLYHNFELEVYQYDLEASDVLASRVKIADWDGYQSPFPTAFYLMQLAPDGKIYSATPTGTDVLHIIHQPDEKGILCQYEQHGIHLPTYNALSMPNFPNYRLGPLAGSSCDTLGLDNRPVAWFRYQRDTLDSLSVLFHDLSYYEPTTWSWDFGDGTPLGMERHPAHTYAQAGVYEVCLTVSNANASNTFCRKLFLGVTAAEDPDVQASISVFPNPFSTRLGMAESGALRGGLFRLFDLSGRLKREVSLVPGIREIDTGDLAAGMYFWEVRVKGERVASGKLVKHIE